MFILNIKEASSIIIFYVDGNYQDHLNRHTLRAKKIHKNKGFRHKLSQKQQKKKQKEREKILRVFLRWLVQSF